VGDAVAEADIGQRAQQAGVRALHAARARHDRVGPLDVVPLVEKRGAEVDGRRGVLLLEV